MFGVEYEPTFLKEVVRIRAGLLCLVTVLEAVSFQFDNGRTQNDLQ